MIRAGPGEAAQGVAGRAGAAGVRGILNLAPTPLRTPSGFFVHDVNLVLELEALSFDRTNRSGSGDDEALL